MVFVRADAVFFAVSIENVCNQSLNENLLLIGGERALSSFVNKVLYQNRKKVHTHTHTAIESAQIRTHLKFDLFYVEHVAHKRNSSLCIQCQAVM